MEMSENELSELSDLLDPSELEQLSATEPVVPPITEPSAPLVQTELPTVTTLASVVPSAEPVTSTAPVISPVPLSDLTPREKMLIEHLERVTGERLDLNKIGPKEEPQLPAEPNFLEGRDLDEVLGSPENFNKLLVAVYNMGVQATERATRNLDTSISQSVASHVAMVDAVREFYQENSDLQPLKRTVAAMANEITSGNPNLTLKEVFEQAASKTRELFGLAKPTPTATAAPASPGFVKPRGRATALRNGPQLTGVAREIDDLFKEEY